MKRRVPLVGGEFYHIYNQSIDGITLFKNDLEFLRMKVMMRYYLPVQVPDSFSHFLKERKDDLRAVDSETRRILADKKMRVRIVAYCLMTTHWHMILQQIEDNGISDYIRCLEDSYSNYFNRKYKRKGPLWVGPFGSRWIEKTSHLLQETSYAHLNPVTACLVRKPADWPHSSFREYLGQLQQENCLCRWQDVLDISSLEYGSFVEGRIKEQKELARIKASLTEDGYTI